MMNSPRRGDTLARAEIGERGREREKREREEMRLCIFPFPSVEKRSLIREARERKRGESVCRHIRRWDEYSRRGGPVDNFGKISVSRGKRCCH